VNGGKFNLGCPHGHAWTWTLAEVDADIAKHGSPACPTCLGPVTQVEFVGSYDEFIALGKQP
jgi:hypothetical protein